MIGVLKGNRKNNIQQCGDIQGKTQCFSRERKKLLKFIGRKKESTAEYITKHQLFQGQKGQPACLAHCLAVNGTCGTIVQRKSGIKAAELQAPLPYT